MEKFEAQMTDHNDNGLELKLVSIDSITIPTHHPRSEYGDLEDLQKSIKRDGLQEPLMVYVIEAGKFGIIDGARRLKAMQKMTIMQVSCLINKGISEVDAAHLSYVKNVERKNLSVIEIARHIKAMRDDFGYTLADLELKGYGSPAQTSIRLKLLELPDKVQMQIQDGTLTAGHGQALAQLPTQGEQEIMAKRIVDFDMTVKRADAQIDRYLSKKRTPKKDQATGIPSGDVQGIYFKDARKMDELLDKSVHLIVTSPPYFVGMEYEVGTTFKDHLENMEAVIKQCARVIVPGGIIALNVGDIVGFKESNAQSNYSQIKLMAHFYQSCMKKHKIYLTDEIIWAKRIAWSKASESGQNFTEDTVHTSYSVFRNWEPIYIFRAKGEREQPSEDIILKSKLTSEQWKAYADGVWKIEAVRNPDGHPCMYPDELVNRLIRMFSYAGDTVLDPFLGSGTTVKVARDLERVGIGYERELKYKPVIMKKLGLIPDEPVAEATKMVEYVEQTIKAVSETTTMAEYVKQSLIHDGSEAVAAAMEAVKSSEPKAEFFGRLTQSEETAEDALDAESVEEFAEVELAY